MITSASISDIVNHFNGTIEEYDYAHLVKTNTRSILCYLDKESNEIEYFDCRTFQPVNKHRLIAEIAGYQSYDELTKSIASIKTSKNTLSMPMKKNEVIGKFYDFKQLKNKIPVNSFFSPVIGLNVIPIFNNKLISNLLLVLPNNEITSFNANPGFTAKITGDSNIQLSSNPFDIKSSSFILTNSVDTYYSKIISKQIELHAGIRKETIFSLFQLITKVYFSDELINGVLSNDNFIYDLRSEDLRKMTQSNNKLENDIRSQFGFTNPDMNDLLEEIISQFYTLDYSRNQDSFTHTISLTYASIKRFYNTLKATYGERNFSLTL